MPHFHTDDRARHDTVLEAAVGLFAAQGFAGTSVPDVAKAARVGLGTLYRYYPSKAALVNGVYRHCKRMLQHTLHDDFPLGVPARAQFAAVWARLYAFARAEPAAFAFLELHHHEPYLDDASRHLELEVLWPIVLWYERARMEGQVGPLPSAVALALIWGAFVGLLKAERAGYLVLTPEVLRDAEQAAWRAIALES